MTKELNLGLAVTGITIKAYPFLNSVEQTAISMPEIGGRGWYQGDMTGTAGTYELIFVVVSGGEESTCGIGKIVWDGASEVVTDPTAPQISSAVRIELATELSRVDVATGSRLAMADFVAPDNATITAINAKTTNIPAFPAAVGSAMALTTDERSSLSIAVESALIDENDGQELLTAIVTKINATDVDVAGLSVTAIATASAAAILSTPENKLATGMDGSVVVGSNLDKTGYGLTSDYDPAKSAATQASVSAIPTTPLLSADYTAPNTPAEIATAVRLELASEMSGIIYMLKTLKNKREVKKAGSVWTLFVYDDDGTTPIMSKDIKDVTGQDIADLAAGVLAQELASV